MMKNASSIKNKTDSRRRQNVASSVAGLIGAPGQGFYSASKFALEGYSEALSVELDPFNIKVSLIEPGYFKTNFNHAMLPPSFHYADYDNVRDVIGSTVSHAIAQGNNPKKVAQTIVFAARSRSPRLGYRVGNEAQWLPRLKAILPDNLFRFWCLQAVEPAINHRSRLMAVCLSIA